MRILRRAVLTVASAERFVFRQYLAGCNMEKIIVSPILVIDIIFCRFLYATSFHLYSVADITIVVISFQQLAPFCLFNERLVYVQFKMNQLHDFSMKIVIVFIAM